MMLNKILSPTLNITSPDGIISLSPLLIEMICILLGKDSSLMALSTYSESFSINNLLIDNSSSSSKSISLHHYFFLFQRD